MAAGEIAEPARRRDIEEIHAKRGVDARKLAQDLQVRIEQMVERLLPGPRPGQAAVLPQLPHRFIEQKVGGVVGPVHALGRAGRERRLVIRWIQGA